MKGMRSVRRRQRKTTSGARRIPAWKRGVTWLTLLSFLLQPMIVCAEIVADQKAPSSRRPVVDTTANGLPLVQITVPSAAGVSRNQYNRFNVDPQGAILNNSRGVVKTQQAGYVAGNPYLVKGSAKVILNEVTSSNPSYLRGYTEVAGQRAEVVIANPNGIVCNGGGFINTSRGVLTTGAPVFGGAGSLDAFRVVGGTISIEGLGLNARNIDQVDLVARSVKVNSELWAKRLNVVTGANQVSYADLGLRTIQGDNNKPLVGIDVAALGGMYANKILLVGTEAGVGVVSAGNIAAQAGDLTIDNQGKITLTGKTNATGHLDLNGKAGILNSGTIYGGQDARITSQLLVENSGTLAAGSDVAIEAASLDSSGVLAAGVQADDGAVGEGDLTVSTTGELKATGQALAGNRMILTGSSLNLANSQTSAKGDIVLTAIAGDIDHVGGILQAGGAVGLSAAAAIKNDNGVVAGDRITISGESLSNQGGEISQFGTGDTQITTVGAMDNSGGLLQSNGAVGLNAGKAIRNDNGAVAGERITISGASLSNQGGEISQFGSGDTQITTVGAMDNSGGLLQSNGAVGLNAGKAIRNDNGVVAGDRITISGASLSNQGGEISQFGTGDTQITISGAMDNSGGLLASNGQNLFLRSGSLNNSNGSLTLTGAGLLMVRSGTLGNNRGILATNGGIDIAAANLDNSDGTIFGTDDLTVQSSGVLSNQRGLIQTDADLNVAAVAALNNAGGRIEANGAASAAIVSGASIDNTAGRIVNSGAGATVVSGGASIVNNNAAGIEGMGVIGGNGDVEINAVNLANTQGGQVVAGGDLDLDASGGLNNSAGTLFAQANLTVNQPGAALTNVGGHIGAAGDVDLTVASLDNTNGRIGNLQDSGGNLGVLASGKVTNTGGEIASDRDLSMIASTLVGAGAVIGGRDASLRLQGDYRQTAANLITANRDLNFSITGNLTNTGTLQASNNLFVNAVNITNQGELGAGDTFSAKTATLRNTGSIVGGDVGITASQKIENVGPAALIGASNAFGKLELLAPIIENRDETTATDTSALTTIYGLGQVVLAGGKDAGSGQYASASRVVNSSGLIQSGGDMAIHADTLINTRRTLTMTSTFTRVGQSNGSAFWTIANPDVPGGRYIEPPHGGTWNSHYVRTDYSETRYRNSLATISPEAQIIAGGNLNPAVNLLRNYWSKVTAAGDISLNSVTLDQDSWRGATPSLERAVYNGTYLYQNYKGVYWRMAWPGPQTIDTPLPGYDASLTAQGNISGSGATIHNTAGSSSATPLGMQAGQTIQAAGGAVVGATVGTTVVATDIATAGPVAQAPVLANLSLPQGGLFHANSEPKARYLVETNPAFTNHAEWLSSDWYFQRMGMDPIKIQKRLGDGFYEQKLIRDEIMSLTGKTVLTGYANEEAQFKEMMTAGAALVQDLDIRPGISLNAEQVAQLTSNVVIMETREVDGNSVLVPVVYLAQINQGDLLPTGSMIAATNINLSNTKTFTNSGTIKASNALSLSGQAIDNRGGNLQSGGLMALNTVGDIDLTSASVKAGSLQLQAGSNLKLNTDAKTISATGPGGSRTSTMLGRVASLDVAGDARIGTGGDLEQKGAQLKVGGDLATDIKGDWRIGTQQTRETSRVNQQGGHSFTDTVQNIGSVIQVGGQSDLKTGGDLIAQGAQIDLAGGGSIQAGGNVELQAAKNSFTLDSASSGSDFAASLKTHDETVVGTSLQSGKSLTVQSGKDIRLAGSSLNVAQGSATLAAAGDVTIQAETEQHTSDWQHTGKHSGVVSTTTTAERDQQDTRIAKGSALSADVVTIQSGKDIMVTGSNVVGTDDVALMAQNDIKIEAAANTRQESHFREEKKSGLLGSGGVGFTIGSQQQSTDAKGASTMAVASTVGSTQGKVTIEAGDDYKQVGSDVLAPQGDINISAKKIDISEARNTSINTTETKFKQSGLTVALSNPVISAVQTVDQMQEAASQTKDPRMKALAAASSGLAAKNAYDAVQAGQGQTINGKKGQIVTGKDADGKLTSRDANAIDKVGGINLSLSVGSSKSRSNSTQTSSTAVGSTVAAGNNVTINATGAAKESDLTVQGSRITAGNNVTLKADDTINLLAAQSTAEQHSTNKSSSGSVGVSFGSQTGLTLAASQGRGNADGSDVTYSNSHVEAGNTLALQSGGDTALKGAVASGRRVVADVGGNLNVESLQDTSTYDSKQKSLGGSVTFGPSLTGSVNFNKSKIKSNYASVTEQSGLKAGDEGFQVIVKGDTALKGAVIASTEQAVQDGKNSLSTGTLTTSDIENHADYSAKSVGVNMGSSLSLDGKLAPSGTSAGFGKDSGNAGSITRAGISGMAGNKDARTGDMETGIAKIFDADKVQKEIDAQVRITQTFGREASKAVGDYAASKLKEAGALREQAQKERDPERIRQLREQASELESQWGDQGTLRLAAHTLIGGLTGDANGAAGAAAGTFTAPVVAQMLNQAGIDGPLAQTLTALASTAVGATVGGTAGAGTAFNEVTNNYLTHSEVKALLARIKDCNGNRDCKQRRLSEAIELSEGRNLHALNARDLAEDVFWGSILLANAAENTSEDFENFVLNTGFNDLYGININQTEANNEYNETHVLTAALGNDAIFMNSWDGQAATSVHQATLITGAVAGPEILAATGISKTAIGGIMGGTYDAVGQLYQRKPGEEYRFGQTAIAAFTGAVAVPLSGTSVIGDAMLGGTMGAINTKMTNEVYGRDGSVLWAAGLGAMLGGGGKYLGDKTADYARKSFPSYIGRSLNPYPDLIGTGVNSRIGAISSFLPLPEAKKGGSK